MKLLPLAMLAMHAIAGAATVGEVRTSTWRIDLHDERGPCAGRAMSAAFVSEAGERIQGCWVPGPGAVFVVFFDGDIATLPPSIIKRPTST